MPEHVKTENAKVVIETVAAKPERPMPTPVKAAKPAKLALKAVKTSLKVTKKPEVPAAQPNAVKTAEAPVPVLAKEDVAQVKVKPERPAPLPIIKEITATVDAVFEVDTALVEEPVMEGVDQPQAEILELKPAVNNVAEASEADLIHFDQLGDILATWELSDGDTLSTEGGEVAPRIEGESMLTNESEAAEAPAEQVLTFFSDQIAELEPAAAEAANENLMAIMELVAVIADIEPDSAEYTEVVEQLEQVCAELLDKLGIKYEPAELKALVAKLLTTQPSELGQPAPVAAPTDQTYEILTDDTFAQRLMNNQAWPPPRDHAKFGRVAMSYKQSLLVAA